MSAANRVRYCLPIHSVTLADARATMARLGPRYDLFELWIDTMAGWSPADLDALCRSRPGQLILVWGRGRSPRDRRSFDVSALLTRLAPLRVTIDLDLDRQPTDIEFWVTLERAAKLVVSHHDYEETPDRAGLTERADRATAAGANVVKIATHCRSPEDAVRLLDLQLELARADRRHVVLGMGEPGAITRVFGTLWSNEWIYAPETTAAESAPGQLTRDQLGVIFGALQPEDRE